MSVITNPSNRLAEIRERAEKATEGPWKVGGKGWNSATVTQNGVYFTAACRPSLQGEMDAEFIAHSREDISWLLERDKERQKLLDALVPAAKRQVEYHAGRNPPDMSFEDHNTAVSALAKLEGK